MDQSLILIAASVGVLSWFLLPVTKRFENNSLRFLRALGPGSLAMLIVGTISYFVFDIEDGQTVLLLATAYLIGAGLRVQFDTSISPNKESSSL